MSSYAQYLTPLIVLQAIWFAAVSAAFRSATDSVQGINRRFRAMPIASLTPLASRMTASMYRCCIALAVSVVCGHVIGFRFHGGVAHAIGFCFLVLLIGAALALIGDLIGIATQNPEATAPVMLVPQLTLGLASVGLQPVERFPDWIESFVRNQPLSQFVYALQALAGDSTSAARRGHVVRDRPGAGLGGGHDCGRCFAARSGFCEAAMMAVASQDRKTDQKATARNGFTGVRPETRDPATSGRHRLPRLRENSPRRLVSHTWVLTLRILRRWSRDPATVVESLVMPAGFLVSTGHRAGGRCFAGHRAQRSLRQRPARRDGRSHDRRDHRRGRHHA